jgi:molybdopterin biosynthesis enzyme MoaB
MIRVGILTLSDRGAAGEYEDRSGPVIRDLVVERLGAEVIEYAVIPDEYERIRDTLVAWVDESRLSLILTTGGGRTLIVNLPGSPKAVRENLESILPALPHALELLREAPEAEAGHTFTT